MLFAPCRAQPVRTLLNPSVTVLKACSAALTCTEVCTVVSRSSIDSKPAFAVSLYGSDQTSTCS
jgi:hypothetical protein